jgi:hypothetical protein
MASLQPERVSHEFMRTGYSQSESFCVSALKLIWGVKEAAKTNGILTKTKRPSISRSMFQKVIYLYPISDKYGK